MQNNQTVLVTGSSGLIGSECVRFFANKGFRVIGIDNDMRKYFFGAQSSTIPNKKILKKNYKNFFHYDVDIRDEKQIDRLFKKNKPNLIIHAAAQPSHDWAAREPKTDFTINALATLYLLESTRKHTPQSTFIFTSTNKVYGDNPNKLPLKILRTRHEISQEHTYRNGIDEKMSIDNCTHSLFGVSKASADLMVQEYGKNFGMNTACFRGGCLTGPAHTPAQLHGFLAYLVNCIVNRKKYTIFGYEGKQVRDNIHAHDVVNVFYHFYQKPRQGEVYNIGGTRHSNISILEAIEKIKKITNIEPIIEYNPNHRIGDHIWYISDMTKFRKHYPKWNFTYNIDKILAELCENSSKR